MKSVLTCSKLQVKASPIHGYGVFAAENIKADSVIEECHSVIHKKKLLAYNSYCFSVKDYTLLAFGYGSIYNHSDNPNARMVFDFEHSIAIFYAKRDIRIGEEICVSYGKQWFDTRNMTPLKPSWRYRLMWFINTLPASVRMVIALGIFSLLFFI